MNNTEGEEIRPKDYGNLRVALRFLFCGAFAPHSFRFDSHATEVVIALHCVLVQERGKDARESHRVGQCPLSFLFFLCVGNEILLNLDLKWLPDLCLPLKSIGMCKDHVCSWTIILCKGKTFYELIYSIPKM